MKPGDRIYNLAVHKIANYHRLRGDEVYAGCWDPMLHNYDKYYFSVIFTWDIPGLIHTVNLVRTWGREIEIGGPAATFMHNYVRNRTGIQPHVGLDPRFEHVPGNYQFTFSSRGCPNKCKFCGVKKVEPIQMEYPEFPLAGVLGDNNILATSSQHQLMVVDKLATLSGKVDINSGFDVRFFTEKHFVLYSKLKLVQWRFAYDTLDVSYDVFRVAKILREAGLDRHQVMFYVLIGFPGTTPEECLLRLNTIRELGMNAYPMRYIPLNSLSHRYVAPGYTEHVLLRLQTYFQTPYIWKSCSLEEFEPSND